MVLLLVEQPLQMQAREVYLVVEDRTPHPLSLVVDQEVELFLVLLKLKVLLINLLQQATPLPRRQLLVRLEGLIYLVTQLSLQHLVEDKQPQPLLAIACSESLHYSQKASKL